MLPVVPAGQSHLQQLGAHGFAVRGHLCCALRVVPASIEQSHRHCTDTAPRFL